MEQIKVIVQTAKQVLLFVFAGQRWAIIASLILGYFLGNWDALAQLVDSISDLNQIAG